MKNAFEDGFDFFVGGVLKIDPEREAFIGAHEAQRLDLEIAADEFSFTEDERVDHAAFAEHPGRSEGRKPGVERERGVLQCRLSWCLSGGADVRKRPARLRIRDYRAS